MARWKNLGARFPGPLGKEIERGDVFEADEKDFVVQMRVNKLERLPDGGMVVKAKPKGDE